MLETLCQGKSNRPTLYVHLYSYVTVFSIQQGQINEEDLPTFKWMEDPEEDPEEDPHILNLGKFNDIKL